jgi:hypothetical protein
MPSPPEKDAIIAHGFDTIYENSRLQIFRTN